MNEYEIILLPKVALEGVLKEVGVYDDDAS